MADETKEQLSDAKVTELSADDKKNAAKRAKKRGVSPELMEAARLQELNALNVQKLTIEYHEKLNAMGFVLHPVLNATVDSIKAEFNLRPMNSAELQQYKDNLEFQLKNAAKNNEVKEEIKDAKPSEEVKESATDVEEKTSEESEDADVAPVDVPA